MSDPLSNTDNLKSVSLNNAEAVPASNTLSEVFLDDGAWSKAQFSSNPEPVKPSNGIQTTSLSNGIETIDDKKALSKVEKNWIFCIILYMSN